MKKLFKPTINKEIGSSKKNKSLCKSANKRNVRKSQSKIETKENCDPIDGPFLSSF